MDDGICYQHGLIRHKFDMQYLPAVKDFHIFQGGKGVGITVGQIWIQSGVGGCVKKTTTGFNRLPCKGFRATQV